MHFPAPVDSGHSALRPGLGLVLELSRLQASLVFLLAVPHPLLLLADAVTSLVLQDVPGGNVAEEVLLQGGGTQAAED